MKLALPPLPLAVDVPAAELITYRLQRFAQWDDPRWGYTALAAALICYALWTWRWYRRELPERLPWRLALTALRLAAAAGIALFFLDPVKRVDQQLVAESEVVVLADASQSMRIEDESSATATGVARIEALRSALADSTLLRDLRRRHHVTLATFADELVELGRWERLPAASDDEAQQPADAPAETAESETLPAAIRDALQAEGAESRLGDALAATLTSAGSRAGPLAGVAVLSDGIYNGGVDPLAAAAQAAERRTPVLTVGLGSTEPRRNVRLQELIVPARGYPNDRVVVRALVTGEGMLGRTIEVELSSSVWQGDQPGPLTRVGAQTVTLLEEGGAVAAEFELTPTEVGRIEFVARLAGVEDDQYAGDNERGAEMEIVDSDQRVLLIAGAASRDYRFLRNQLQRDPHIMVDVWLQTSPAGISQDADAILDQFPTTREALFEYDAILAFDPDWTLLDDAQQELLEQWVAEEAGGLVVQAGPVNVARWASDARCARVRALYPVEFQRRLTLLDDGQYGSETPWPIEFSREGEEAEFLWIDATPAASRRRWEEFPGVYGCYAVKGPKPGAVTYGRYGDPDAGLSLERPVYLAEHFYGAGRVFYMGSGELWRLRSLDPGVFEQLTTQLIRHVSQGRLLRGSSRGRLLVERDRYQVGESVVVRAQLATLRREPYVAPKVVLRVTRPHGAGDNVDLTADPNRPGSYLGQFRAGVEGSYRLELPIPEATDEQLTRRIQAAAPDKEFSETRRDETLLAELAAATGGRYFADWRTAVAVDDGEAPLAERLPSRAETRIVRGQPDKTFAERLHRGLLALVVGALGLEWLTRRLLKLA